MNIDDSLDNLFCNPSTKSGLIFSSNSVLVDPSTNKSFPVSGNVISFLDQPDAFYEGAYLNRVYFMPKSEKWYHIWPLRLISNNYLWTVRKFIPKGALVLELGCASGVDYFGARYKMIGLDLSLSSLKHLHEYTYAIQADAASLPLRDCSIDGIISSYFWEHIPPTIKDQMMLEFQRVLKPGGKIIFLYDLETDNGFINILKKGNIALYNRLFLEKDGHLGYETPKINKERFQSYGFEVLEHFGMERTWIQSLSVYEKYRHLTGWPRLIGQLCYSFSKLKITTFAHIFLVRIIDETIGRLFSINKSRIIISVLQKT